MRFASTQMPNERCERCYGSLVNTNCSGCNRPSILKTSCTKVGAGLKSCGSGMIYRASNFLKSYSEDICMVGLPCVIMSVFMIGIVYLVKSPDRLRNELRAQYADTNRDGVISSDETSAFDDAYRDYLTREKGVRFVQDVMYNGSGERIWGNLETDLLREYARRLSGQ